MRRSPRLKAGRRRRSVRYLSDTLRLFVESCRERNQWSTEDEHKIERAEIVTWACIDAVNKVSLVEAVNSGGVRDAPFRCLVTHNLVPAAEAIRVDGYVHSVVQLRRRFLSFRDSLGAPLTFFNQPFSTRTACAIGFNDLPLWHLPLYVKHNVILRRGCNSVGRPIRVGDRVRVHSVQAADFQLDVWLCNTDPQTNRLVRRVRAFVESRARSFVFFPLITWEVARHWSPYDLVSLIPHSGRFFSDDDVDSDVLFDVDEPTLAVTVPCNALTRL